MTEKNIFVYKCFAIKYFKFQFIFYEKLQPPEKVHPLLSRSPFLKIWQGVQTPSPKQEGGMHTMQLSPPHPPPCYQVLTRLVCCFTRNTLSTFLPLIRLLQKIMRFQIKTNFFFQLIAGVLILLFCEYVFLRIEKSRIE